MIKHDSNADEYPYQAQPAIRDGETVWRVFDRRTSTEAFAPAQVDFGTAREAFSMARELCADFYAYAAERASRDPKAPRLRP